MTFDPDAPQNETDRSEAVNNTLEAVADAPPLRDENMDEQNPDAVILANPQWGGLAMLSMAASMTESAASAVVMAANYNVFRARDLHDEFNMTNGGGTLENYVRKALEGVDRDDPDSGDNDKDDEGLTYADVAEEREERRHEREEWSHSEHEFAGVEMTGEQWGELASDIGPNGKLHQWLIQRYMKNGKTQAEAEQEADETQALFKIEAKPESQRTPEETERLKAADNNPEFRATTAALKGERDKGFGASNDVEQTTTRANQAVSVSTRADAFDDKDQVNTVSPAVVSTSPSSRGVADFPSAPDLTMHYQAAVAATEPLDASKANPQIAAVAPTPAPGSGFDA